MTPRPPSIPRLWLRLVVPEPYRAAVLTEMRLAFVDDARKRSRTYARWRYWIEALSPATLRLRRELRPQRIPTGGRRPSGAEMIERVIQDVRFALRSFARKPGYALTAVAILGIGIGATTAIFTVVDHVLLRALPYPDSEELVFFDRPSFPVPFYLMWRERASSFASMGAVWPSRGNFTGDGPPTQLNVVGVSPGFFATLGVEPALGRQFLAQEYAAQADALILGYGAWVRRFGADPEILGRTLTIDGSQRRVVGVFGPEFEEPEALVDRTVDLWVPYDVESPDEYIFGRYVLSVVGRLAPGVTVDAARAELANLSQLMAQEDPEHYVGRDGEPRPMSVTPLHEYTVASVGPTLYLLLGAVGLMLLIACANVANLALARGAGRARELALRAAIGAGRMRLAAQMLTENLVLALAACLAGLLLARAGVAAFARLDPGGIPRTEALSLDVRVLGFSMLVAAVTGLAFGMLPALQAARSDVGAAIKDGGSGATSGRRGLQLRGGLVVAEIALALMLLVGAGLLFHSFLKLTSVEPGFDTENLITVRLPLETYPPDQRAETLRQMLESIEACAWRSRCGRGRDAAFRRHRHQPLLLVRRAAADA